MHTGPSGVPRDEPAWWYGDPHKHRLVSTALAPAAAIYGWIAVQRIRKAKPYRCSLPVVCVGNFTAGGTGKTPLSRLIAELLRKQGREPVFLTRGYKGREAGPVWVDREKHSANDVGDEPLLLAADAPVMVSRDRAAGAKAIEAAGNPNPVIIMDDGLQNPQLAKDLVIAVVDAGRRLGNERVIPAGPLRAPLAAQRQLADAILLNGAQSEDLEREKQWARDQQLPSTVLTATVTAGPASLPPDNAPIIAFAGIANPERFFTLLERCGKSIAERVAFPDHHDFTDDEARDLMARANHLGANLITTEKDRVRLAGGSQTHQLLLERSNALAITLDMPEQSRSTLERLIDEKLLKK